MARKPTARQMARQRLINDYLTAQNSGYHSPAARAAVALYPALATAPTSEIVLTCARVLDVLPRVIRVQALERFECADQDVKAALAEFPPMPGRAERMARDAQLANLIRVIEQHSTPFDVEAYTRARLAPDAPAFIDESDKPDA